MCLRLIAVDFSQTALVCWETTLLFAAGTQRFFSLQEQEVPFVEGTEMVACMYSPGRQAILESDFATTTALGVKTSCTLQVEGNTLCVRDGGEWKDCPVGADLPAWKEMICAACECVCGELGCCFILGVGVLGMHIWRKGGAAGVLHFLRDRPDEDSLCMYNVSPSSPPHAPKTCPFHLQMPPRTRASCQLLATTCPAASWLWHTDHLSSRQCWFWGWVV